MNPIIIPFAGVLGTESGESSNGAVHSKLARVNVPSVLSSVISSSGSKIYHGDADSSGNIAYHNMTTAANNDTAIAGSTAIGSVYRNGADPDLICVVH